MNKKKIILVGSRNHKTGIGGIEVHCSSIAPYLKNNSNGAEIFLLTCDTVKSFVEKNKQDYIHINIFSAAGLFQKLFASLKWILIIRRLNPHIVHVHGIGSAFLCLILKILRSKVTIFITHHDLGSNRPNNKLIETIMFKLAEWLACLSDDQFTVVNNCTSGSIFIQNAVSVPSDNAQLEAMSLLHKEKIDPGKYLISSGRMSMQKGTVDLLDAYEIANTDLPLVLIGSVEKNFNLEITENDACLKSPKRIVFLGSQIHDIALAMTNMSACFISASHYEAFGLSAAEAYRLGVPLILSNIPAHKPWASNITEFHDVGDIGGLIKAISKIENKPQFLKATDGFRNCDFTTWEDVSEQYGRFYRNC